MSTPGRALRGQPDRHASDKALLELAVDLYTEQTESSLWDVSELVKKSETVARASLSVRDKAPYVKMGGV